MNKPASKNVPLTEAQRIRHEVRMQRSLTSTLRKIDLIAGTQTGIGWRLDRYLSTLFPRYTRSMLQRWCRNGWVYDNAGRVYRSKDPVKALMTIIIRAPISGIINDDDFVAPPLEILHKDDGFLICNKPAGQLAHQAGKVLTGTLLNQLQDYFEEQGIDPSEARLVNRIDRDTSGIVLASWQGDTTRLLSDALQSHQLRKEYLALCHGVPEKKHGHWHEALQEGPPETVRRMVHPDGQASHTEYTVVKSHDNFSLLRIRLHTGRQHQIRIHAAHHGHPLIGDWVYGTPCTEIGGQALHAALLSFAHPYTGDMLTIEAPLATAIDQCWHGILADQGITPCELSDMQKSKLGLLIKETELGIQLDQGWRKPSWMSDDDFQKLQQQS